MYTYPHLRYIDINIMLQFNINIYFSIILYLNISMRNYCLCLSIFIYKNSVHIH